MRNNVPWPGSQEDIWDILDRDHINDTLFLCFFFFSSSFLVYNMQTCIYVLYIYISGGNANPLTFERYVQLSLLHLLITIVLFE